jgi:hypothetical protein
VRVRAGLGGFLDKRKNLFPLPEFGSRITQHSKFREKKCTSYFFDNYIKCSVVQISEMQIILFRNLQSKQFPSFHETQVALQCSQKTATGPYPEHSILWKSKNNTEQYLYVQETTTYSFRCVLIYPCLYFVTFVIQPC